MHGDKSAWLEPATCKMDEIWTTLQARLEQDVQGLEEDLVSAQAELEERRGPPEVCIKLSYHRQCC